MLSDKIVEVISEEKEISVHKLTSKLGVKKIDELLVMLHNTNQIRLEGNIVKKIEPGQVNEMILPKKPFMDKTMFGMVLNIAKWVVIVIIVLSIPTGLFFMNKFLDYSNEVSDMIRVPYDIGVDFSVSDHEIAQGDDRFILQRLRPINMTVNVLGVDSYHDDKLKFHTHDYYVTWGSTLLGSSDVFMYQDNLARVVYDDDKYRFPKYEFGTQFHAIPASPEVYEVMKNVSVEDVVEIDADWVIVKSDVWKDALGNPWAWGKDSVLGDSECEVVVIKSIRVVS